MSMQIESCLTCGALVLSEDLGLHYEWHAEGQR